MRQHFPILILAIPLLTAFAISLFARKSDRLAQWLFVLAMGGAFFASVGAFAGLLTAGVPLHYRLGNWPPPFGIELVIDHLNGLILVVVSGVALLVAIYSLATAVSEVPERTPQSKVAERVPNFCVLACLMVTGLLGMTATGDAFNLYVLLEITALSGYALLALGGGRAYYATFRYVVMGTIGACLYLLGVGYLYIKTGSLNMADLALLLQNPDLRQSQAIRTGFVCIIVGVWIKMAFFPMHGWLPNAYSRATDTVSALVAPLVTKVSVYVMVRMMFTVFSVDYLFGTIQWSPLVVWCATAAILFGSLSALAQNDLKRMLCYLIVAEVGYMVGGVWLGNGPGFIGAVYHIGADALMTVCLFMAVGAVSFRTGDRSLDAMARLFKMPLTAAVFLVGAASMVGIPPTAGFFSKWYLITGGVQAGHYQFVAALLVSSLVNAFLFFRLIERAYFGFTQQHTVATGPVVREASFAMLLPMVSAAVLIIGFGLSTKVIIEHVIRLALPGGF